MRVLVTGGAGFIGSHFIRSLLNQPRWKITSVLNVDLLTYAGNLKNTTDFVDDPRYQFVQADIGDRSTMNRVFSAIDPEWVVHFAAESNVDRSIQGAHPFLATNVIGTHVLLEVVREYPEAKFLHVSTDEVYGTLETKSPFTESSPLLPSSPYSASKGSGDLLVRAYFRTHGVFGITSRCSNNFGSHQHPEKFIPKMITQALEGKSLTIYGDGKNTRDWILVSDHCQALLALMEKGRPGEIYNIGSGIEKANLDIATMILSMTGNSSSTVQFVTDRRGHDRRYSIDSTKVKNETGWNINHRFEESLAQTVEWYRSNEAWWRPLVDP